MPKHTAKKRARVKRTKVKGTRKVHKVMKEFKAGTLKSSSGQTVKSRKQAIAIGLSEQREADRKAKRRRKKDRR